MLGISTDRSLYGRANINASNGHEIKRYARRHVSDAVYSQHRPAENGTRRACRGKIDRRSGRIRAGRKALTANSQRQHCLQSGDEWLINVI